MKKLRLRSCLVCFLSVFFLFVSTGSALTPAALRCEFREDPLGVDSATPPLSWLLQSSQRGDSQTAYQILVASTPALLSAGTGDLWDSGQVTSGSSLQIPYGGVALVSAQKVYWKVRVWDAANTASAWSAPATWTMGVLNAADWSAQWITPSTAATDVKSTLLRRDFTVGSGLVRALVNVSGLGEYEMSLNGNRVGQDMFTPGWTKYDKTVLYDTYDVTSLLQSGANAIGIFLGNGMYNIPDNSGRYVKLTRPGFPRKAIARLRLEYANGTVQTVVTDGNWKWANGPITFNTTFGGEDYDARLEQAGWNSAGFNEGSWSAVTVTTGPGGTLRGTSYAAPAIRKQAEVFQPTPAIVPTAASKVYDFVQNASNIPTLVVYGPAGATVKLSSAEVGSTAGNGSISQINDPSYSIYTLKGSTAAAPETNTPRFVYIGYRYLKVELTGGATLVSLTSSPVHTSSAMVGEFSSSKTLFNDIRRITRWAQRSNLVSLLTDCPTREKQGWLEQYHLHGPSLRYEFDLAAFFRKTYTDMADSQLSNGMVPTTAPEYTVFGGDFRDSPEWGSSFVLSPEQQYDFYGDLSSISRHYANMKRYVDYLTSRASNNIISFGLGDWYDIGPNGPGESQLTPKALTATAMYFADARAVAMMAQKLGNTADANTYTTLAANIRNAFNSQFYNAATGSYATDSQTTNAIPLAFGLVEDANRARTVAALVRRVRADGNSVTAGDVGHRYLLRALADAGRSDVIYDIHSKLGTRGYAYIISQGYTALTEGWDGSNSKNHFMLGHIMEWFYHDLAGIAPDPAGPAFQKIIVRPQIVGDVTWAKATYQSSRGPITSDWALNGTDLTLKVSVPPGSTATVYVPTLSTPTSSLVVRESGTIVWQNGTATGNSTGLTYDHVETGNPLQSSVVWKIGSGNYTFTATLTPVPSGIAATPGAGQIAVAWNASPGATSYNLKRSLTSGGPYSTIASNLTATTFTDGDITEGLNYYYVVSAQLSGGESGNSLEATAATIPGGNTGFEYPVIAGFQYNPTGALWVFSALNGTSGSGISGNASGFTSSNPVAPEGKQVAFLQGAGSFSKSFKTVPGFTYVVTFSASQRNYGSPTGQTWDLQKDGITFASFSPPPSATAYADYSGTFVATATSHSLSFVGTNTRGGDNTVFIDNVRVTGGEAPLLNAVAGDSVVHLSWSSVVGATGYRIKRATSSGGPFTTILSSTGTIFSDTGLANGTAYFYTAVAIGASGEGPASVSVSATPAASASLVARATNAGGISSGSNEGGSANENIAKLFDGSTTTKWYQNTASANVWIQYQFANARAWAVTRYTLTSANDAPGRDPAAWRFDGSNNGSNWTTLNSQTGQTFTARGQTKTYDFSNTTPYRYYRLYITAIFTPNSGIQLAEIGLFSSAADAGDKTPPVLTLPANISANATGYDGAIVTFSPTASDAVHGNIAVISTPASGSQFPIGNTVVQCSATDPAGNTATGSFSVTIINSLPPSNQLTGTVIGTPGTWGGGNTRDKAFDGDLTTFFDAPADGANNSWVGLDLGSRAFVTEIRYAPRPNQSARMVGGLFQGGNTPDFSDAVTFATITATPSTGVLTSRYVSSPSSFRYLRYLSAAADSFGNVAEVQFFGYLPTPPTPGNLTAIPGDASVALTWSAATGATGYTLKRSTAYTGPYASILANTPALSSFDNNLTNGVSYYYIVTASNGTGESAASSAIRATPIGAEQRNAPQILTATSGATRLTMSSSVAGRTYQLQRTYDLGVGNWENLGEPQNGGGVLNFSDPSTTDPAKAFYRILIGY